MYIRICVYIYIYIYIYRERERERYTHPIVDSHSDKIPDGDYLELCNLFKDAYTIGNLIELFFGQQSPIADLNVLEHA